MNILKKILIAIGVGLVVVLLIESPYLWKQARYISGTIPGQTETPAPQPQRTEPNILNIPSLGITAPIQYVDVVNEDVFQEALKNGVVHYPGTAELGAMGNAYIFGHSSDYPFSGGNYKTVFALLPRIEKGAEIVVSDREGKLFRYRVIDTKVVNNNDLSVLSQDTEGKKILSIQTSYPVGTALKRFVVRSELVE